MERRPPNSRVQDRAGHDSAKMRDAKQALTKNEAAQSLGGHHEGHEPQTEEDFLHHMSEKLKESGKDKNVKK